MIKIEEIPSKLERLRQQRKTLFFQYLGICPDCVQGVVCKDVKDVEQLYEKIKANKILLSNYMEYNALLEYELEHKGTVKIGDILVDCWTSDNYYLCKCTKCGKTWQVSKRELKKEKNRLDREIAKLEDCKATRLSRLEDLFRRFGFLIPLTLSIAGLVCGIVAYFY